MPGPIPMRSEELSRERDAHRSQTGIKLTRGKSVPSKQPKPDPKWDPMVLELYKSAASTGMSPYYEASDWALLRMLCDDISTIRISVREAGAKYPAMMYQTLLSQLTSFGFTEGDRRRMRIELVSEEDGADEAEVSLAVISDYRAKLTAARSKRGA